MDLSQEIPRKRRTPGKSRFLDPTTMERLAYYPRAAKAIEMLFNRIDERIALEDVASWIGMNPSSLSRYFASKVGMSLFTVLRALRVERAVEEIERGDCPLSLLAESLGYRNSCTFGRAFKQVTGMTPSAYRKNVAGR